MEIKAAITDIFNKNYGRYGYRRITLELHNRGYKINHKTVQRLMKVLKIKSMVRIKKYHSYKGMVGKTAPNLLQRKFNATMPNQKWVTDITEFALNGNKLYLSVLLDLYNREIISYNISGHPVLNQVLDMLDKAFRKIPDNTKLILHSDQGWQYQHKKYQMKLKEGSVTTNG